MLIVNGLWPQPGKVYSKKLSRELAMAGWWCLLLVAAVSVAYTEGSTLDLYEAILRVPFLNRSGQDEWDFFGYSVALHDTVDPSPGRTFLDRLSGAR